MVIEILKEWNPWWEKKELVRELEGRNRPAYRDLLDSISIREITIITGVRRSGKSTLMYQMVDNLLRKNIEPEQILFINLEDKKLSDVPLDVMYQEYRENLNPGKNAFIFLDEIHLKKEWEAWIRKKYDLKTKDKFVISGSCSYLLKKEYSTLLTGRNLTFEVFPLSFKEYLTFKNMVPEGKVILERTKLPVLNALKKYLEYGGFPEIFFKPERYKKQVLGQYFDDIIYKDIIGRHDLNSEKTRELALFLTTNFTREISLKRVRKSLGLSYDLTKEYVSHFKDAFLFFTLDHFSYSFMEQKSRAQKMYCIDTGLRNAVSFKFSKDEGKLAENTVFLELHRQAGNLYYWSKNGEVDFVVKEKDNSLSAINVSYTNEINEREIASLLEFKKEFEKTRKLLILTKDVEKKEKGIEFIPLWKWLVRK